MAKKIALLLSILMLATCIFAGCATEDYTFSGLKGDTKGLVSSNGGVVVEKGDYLYYINGAVANNSSNNFGEVIEGSICRILKTDFDSAVKSSTVTEEIASKSQVVVPKIFYQGQLQDRINSGIYIFEDRIYYYTPSTELDRNAAIMYYETCLKSCALDGTDTQHLYTFKTNPVSAVLSSLSNVDGKLFVTFNYITKTADAGLAEKDKVKYNKEFKEYENKLFVLDVASGLVEQIDAETEIVVVKYNWQTGVAYYLNQDMNEIKKYVVGGKPTTVIKSTEEKLEFLNLVDDQLFIKTTKKADGIATIKTVKPDGTISVISNYIYSTFRGLANGYLFVSGQGSVGVYDSATNSYKYTTETKASISFISVIGNYLYYTLSECKNTAIEDGIYRVDITADKLVEEFITSKKIYTNFASIDVAYGYVFFINSEKADKRRNVYPLNCVELANLREEKLFDLTKYVIPVLDPTK
ncbi:MAG: hypothetical protein RR248_00480 [Clostridia bacterium]